MGPSSLKKYNYKAAKGSTATQPAGKGGECRRALVRAGAATSAALGEICPGCLQGADPELKQHLKEK